MGGTACMEGHDGLIQEKYNAEKIICNSYVLRRCVARRLYIFMLKFQTKIGFSSFPRRESSFMDTCIDLVVYFVEYSITCIQRPPKGRNENGLLQQVVFKCRCYQVDFRRFYQVDLRRDVLS